MTVGRRNPPGLHTPPGYHHVTIAEGRRLVFLSGQCPLTQEGQVVPGDLAGQVDQIVANTALALAGAGASPDDIVRTVVYVGVPSGPSFPRCGRGSPSPRSAPRSPRRARCSA
jgi:enamine deaminase RidA (YjgF/YER057c/UK114 family)